MEEQVKIIIVNVGAEAAVKNLKELEDMIIRISKGQRDSKKASGEMLSGISTITNAARAFIGLRIVQEIASIGASSIRAASQMEQWRISFEVMLGSASKANQVLDQIRQFADTTPFEFPELVQSAETLSAFGFTAEEILPNLRMLGDLARGDGQRMRELALSYGQMRTEGQAMARDLREFSVRGVGLSDELRRMGITGVASFSQVQEALRRMTSEGGQYFGMTARMAMTFQGRLSTLNDSVSAISRSFGEGMLPSLMNSVQYMNEITGSQSQEQWRNLGRVVGAAAEAVAKVAGFLLTVITRMSQIQLPVEAMNRSVSDNANRYTQYMLAANRLDRSTANPWATRLNTSLRDIGTEDYSDNYQRAQIAEEVWRQFSAQNPELARRAQTAYDLRRNTFRSTSVTQSASGGIGGGIGGGTGGGTGGGIGGGSGPSASQLANEAYAEYYAPALAEIRDRMKVESTMFGQMIQIFDPEVSANEVEMYMQHTQGMIKVTEQFASGVNQIMSSLDSADKIRQQNKYNRYKNYIVANIKDETERKAALQALDDYQEMRSAKIAYESAKRNKAIMLMNAIVNTAAGITSALAMSGPPWIGIAMAAIVGAMGAAQIGLISATPLPQAAEGALIKGSSAGTALIAGEGGRSEMIVPFENEEVMGRSGFGTTVVNLNIENLYATEDVPQGMAMAIDRALYNLQRQRNSSFASAING